MLLLLGILNLVFHLEFSPSFFNKICLKSSLGDLVSREREVYKGYGALVAHGLPHRLRVFEHSVLIVHEFESLLLLETTVS